MKIALELGLVWVGQLSTFAPAGWLCSCKFMKIMNFSQFRQMVVAILLQRETVSLSTNVMTSGLDGLLASSVSEQAKMGLFCIWIHDHIYSCSIGMKCCWKLLNPKAEGFMRSSSPILYYLCSLSIRVGLAAGKSLFAMQFVLHPREWLLLRCH